MGGHYFLPVQKFCLYIDFEINLYFLAIRDSFYVKLPQQFPEFQKVTSFLRLKYTIDSRMVFWPDRPCPPCFLIVSYVK